MPCKRPKLVGTPSCGTGLQLTHRYQLHLTARLVAPSAQLLVAMVLEQVCFRGLGGLAAVHCVVRLMDSRRLPSVGTRGGGRGRLSSGWALDRLQGRLARE